MIDFELGKYISIEALLKDVKNHKIQIRGREKYINVVQKISQFINIACLDLITFHNYEELWDIADNYLYDDILKKRNISNIVIAQIRINAIPPYSVFPIATLEDAEFYKNYKRNKLIMLGNVWRGYCAETYVNKKMILWNHKKMY